MAVSKTVNNDIKKGGNNDKVQFTTTVKRNRSKVAH